MNYSIKHKDGRLKKKIVFLGIILLFILAWVGWQGASTFIESQKKYPLNKKIEYVGKRDYGCLGLCGSYPASTYSYATDLTPRQIVDQFNIIDSEISKYSEFIGINLEVKSTSNTIQLSYYENGAERLQKFNLSKSLKKHVIEMNAKDYELAKNALK